MTITIPIWLMWLIGVPLGMIGGFFTVFGAIMMYALKDGIYK